MKFTNISAGPRGLNTKSGTVLVEPRQSIDVDIESAEKKIALDTGWFVEGDAPQTREESDVSLAALQAQLAERDTTITDLNKAATDRDEIIADLKAKLAKHEGGAGPEAKHRGAGSYSIMDGDTELREKLTKDQADAFNKLDAEGKDKWLADNPKPAA
jgi:hypothetical protein